MLRIFITTFARILTGFLYKNKIIATQMPNNKEKLQRRKEISLLLKEKLIEALDIPYEPRDISEDIALIGSGLGLDSLDVLEIVLCVENNFGVKVPEGQTLALRSLNTLIDFIISEQDKK